MRSTTVTDHALDLPAPASTVSLHRHRLRKQEAEDRRAYQEFRTGR